MTNKCEQCVNFEECLQRWTGEFLLNIGGRTQGGFPNSNTCNSYRGGRE